jgi:nitrogen PTS system EIIA component
MVATLPMNQIAGLLATDHIVAGLDVSSKKRVFEQAGLLFENSLGIARSVVYDALFEREKLGSTGLGLGVAIPHGRIKGLKQATGAFLRLQTPVQFDSPDSKPVDLVFVLLVPEAANDQHLQLLSELAQMFSARSFREQIYAAPDALALRDHFAQWHE